MLWLVSCGGSPPPQGPTVRCEQVPAGLVGEIVEVDGSTRPAFSCAGYWRCEEFSWLEGIVDDVDDVWDDPEQSLDDADLWCERCGWAGAPAAELADEWAELVVRCDWR